MKKLLLTVTTVLAVGFLNAQIYVANDSLTFSNWVNIDRDADGFDWDFVNMAGSSFDAQGYGVKSHSYDNTAGVLTPDNVLISPAINLSAASSPIELSFKVGSTELTSTNWYKEHYAVYVVTDTTGMRAGTFPTPVLEKTLAAGDSLFQEKVSISSMAGQAKVFIVFRHYNCTDMFFLFLDDVMIKSTAGVEEKTIEAKVYPNPAADVLNIKVEGNISTVSIKGLDGKIISTQLVNASTAMIDVANLSSGVYMYEMNVEGTIVRNTFVKK